MNDAVSRVHLGLLCQGARTAAYPTGLMATLGSTRSSAVIRISVARPNSEIVKLKMFVGASYGPVRILSANPL
jgi:hypothetical protein